MTLNRTQTWSTAKLPVLTGGRCFGVTRRAASFAGKFTDGVVSCDLPVSLLGVIECVANAIGQLKLVLNIQVLARAGSRYRKPVRTHDEVVRFGLSIAPTFRSLLCHKERITQRDGFVNMHQFKQEKQCP